jgi:putative membrane protein insertion efficiency factor
MATVSRETVRSGRAPASGDHGVDVSRETDTTDARRAGFLRRVGTAIVLAPLRLYRRFISPLSGPRCRYYPTCSTYAEQAVRELGPVRGTILALWRVARCNPFSSGGLDPLENRRLFRSPNPDDVADEPPETDT